MKPQLIIPSVIILIFISCRMETKPVYPETAREQVTDNYFGVKIEDPYRWLEDEASPARAAWIEAQNRVTNEYL
ncbi:MAG: hypothetical protein LBF79_05065, partial [Dysgonamonadaceae bacterium]|nr:hypothetical protein [Dysgonamonadaceae bacterium]